MLLLLKLLSASKPVPRRSAVAVELVVALVVMSLRSWV
jgi:hypothetical protein